MSAVIKKSKVESEVKSRIIKAAEALRRKYNQLQTLKREKHILLEENFEPITRPLKELNAIKARKETLKRELKEEEEVKDEPKRETLSPRREEEEEEEVVTGDDDDDYDVPRTSLFDEYAGAKSKNLDFTYGPKADLTTTGGYLIGDKKIKFDKNNDDIELEGIDAPFKATRGLYELIFMRKPRDYTRNDLVNYKTILETSKAHKKRDGKVISSKADKYKKVISKLFPSKRGGSIMDDDDDDASMLVTNNKIDYVHWIDPNLLVDRYVLCKAAYAAGNKSVLNEIRSIENELRRTHHIR